MNKHKFSEDKSSNITFRYLYIHTHTYQQTYTSKHIQKYIHTIIFSHIHIPTCSCTYIFIYHSNNLFLNLFARSKYFPRLESSLRQLHSRSQNLHAYLYLWYLLHKHWLISNRIMSPMAFKTFDLTRCYLVDCNLYY